MLHCPNTTVHAPSGSRGHDIVERFEIQKIQLSLQNPYLVVPLLLGPFVDLMLIDNLVRSVHSFRSCSILALLVVVDMINTDDTNLDSLAQ